MKIAVYGDSFASGYTENFQLAWYNLLAEKLNGKVIDEQGREGLGIAWGGRATYLSYKNFLKYYKDYDFNIFVAGDPYRHTKEYQGPYGTYYVSNLNCVDWALQRKIINDVDAELLRGWFLMSDHNFLVDTQELILKDIEQKDPKCLIIPAQIETSFVKERMINKNMNFALTTLHSVQLRSMNAPSDYWPRKEPPNKICCHYSVETNKWLANAVYEYLINNKKLELPEYIPHEHDYRYYYEEQ